jgi:hypothetical protein
VRRGKDEPNPNPEGGQRGGGRGRGRPERPRWRRRHHLHLRWVTEERLSYCARFLAGCGGPGTRRLALLFVVARRFVLLCPSRQLLSSFVLLFFRKGKERFYFFCFRIFFSAVVLFSPILKLLRNFVVFGRSSPPQGRDVVVPGLSKVGCVSNLAWKPADDVMAWMCHPNLNVKW